MHVLCIVPGHWHRPVRRRLRADDERMRLLFRVLWNIRTDNCRLCKANLYDCAPHSWWCVGRLISM